MLSWVFKETVKETAAFSNFILYILIYILKCVWAYSIKFSFKFVCNIESEHHWSRSWGEKVIFVVFRLITRLIKLGANLLDQGQANKYSKKYML